jgi:tripeptidyl-peptidase I
MSFAATVNDPEGACEQVIFRYTRYFLLSWSVLITPHASSGGGFSDIFAMPEYQREAVEQFFQEHPPPFTSAQFNNSGKVCRSLAFGLYVRVASDAWHRLVDIRI